MTSILSRLKYIAKELHFSLFGNRGKFRSAYDDTVFTEEKALTEEYCSELIEIIDGVISTSGKSLWHDSAGSDVRIWGFEKHIPEQLDQLHIDKALQDISAYLGSRVTDWMLMANKTTAVSGNLGSGGGFHRDSAYSHQIKVIWYLSKVSAENGPFSYVPGSHRRLYAPDSLLRPPATRLAGTPEYLESVTGESGLKLIADTRCIHGGLPVEVESRYAITLYTVTNRNGLSKIRKSAGLLD